jgi:hypothetical protein
MRKLHKFCTVVALGALVAGVAPVRAVPAPSRNLPSYVLLGIDTLNMKEFTFENLGNIGVNNAGGTMAWGQNSFFANGSEVVTDVLKRAGKKSSIYDLFTNVIVSPLAQSGATVRHDGPASWSPLPLITLLPPTPTCVAGSTPVSVPKNGSLTLPPGAYGRLLVANGASLELTGGTYCFSDVKTGRKALITVDAPSDITVLGKLRTNTGTVLRPADGSGIGASDIMVGVAGSLVKLSHKNKVFGIFYVPNGQLRFGHGGFYTGQFVARDLRSDFGDSFTLEDCGNGVVDTGEQCDEGDGNGQPGHCCSKTCDTLPAGTLCPDGDLCNGAETCSAAGQCVHGTPLSCNNGNPCTVETCIPATGCHSDDKPDGTSCSDGAFCNGGEVCVGGTCTNQLAPDCNDHNPCTVDSCNPANNACQNTPVDHPVPGCACPNGDSDCDNNNKCDGKETCDPSHQFCHPGTPLVCTTTNQCLDPICNPQTGCGTTPKPSGTSCSDGDVCSVNDECTGSTCGGFVLSCDDGDPCTADACDSQTGCSNTPIPGCGTGGGTLCTLTQGAYGAGNGAANGGQGWITNNPGVLPAAIGAPGTGASVTINTQAGLIAFMPTNGTPNALNPVNGDVVINGAGDVPDPQGTGSGGDGAGTLAGQTLAMTLNVALSNLGAKPTGLGSFVLTASFCTCDGGTAGPFTISQCVLDNAVTVNNLLVLANQALRGINLAATYSCSTPGDSLTYSDIASALDALNNGFDECRTVCSCTP